MPDDARSPAAPGWYPTGGGSGAYGYFDGTRWTWHGWRGPDGSWHQSPVVPAAQGEVGGGPGPLELVVGPSPAQRRWTVALRAILVLPNLVVLLLLQMIAGLAVIATWFAALVTGRPPAPLWDFLRGVLGWTARTAAYEYLLTDRAPPFSLEEVPYPVGLRLAGRPERLNRWSVLFRAVLYVPAWAIDVAFQAGAAFVAFIAWLCAVVAGRVPEPLYLTLAAALRYSLRSTAYFQLLTPEYPWGVLGDRRVPHAPWAPHRLVLPGAARAVAIGALVLGSAVVVVDWSSSAALARRAVTPTAAQQLDAMSLRVVDARQRYLAAIGACATRLDCVEASIGILSSSLATQIATLRHIDFSSPDARHDALALVALLRRERAVMRTMRRAPTAASFGADAHELVPLTVQIVHVATRLHRLVTSPTNLG